MKTFTTFLALTILSLPFTSFSGVKKSKKKARQSVEQSRSKNHKSKIQKPAKKRSAKANEFELEDY